MSRVIGFSKLKAKFKSFESRRQLAAQHDIFLADDRIIPSLPQILGKAFYKGGEKRPIPVELAGNRKGREKAVRDSLGQKRKREQDEPKGSSNVGTTETVAKEIERALNSALIHLSPSVTTAVKVAHAGMDSTAVSENIEAVCKGMVEKFIPQGWRNVRAIHVKGPNTMALPVWLASELWLQEEDVLDEKWKPAEGEEGKKKLKGSKKRLLTAGDGDFEEQEQEIVAKKKKRKSDAVAEEQPAKKAKKAKKDEEVALRKETLKEQKARAREDISKEADVSNKRVQDAPPATERAIKKAKAVMV